MGCISSKKELRDINPNMYRVINVDDAGTALWSGQLSISRTELTLFRKHKEPTQWPLKCLRRYGYDNDVFTFEAGRRCTTGEGIYAFRCRHAESLFRTVQNYIQIPATFEENQMDVFPLPIATNGPAVTPRNRSSIQSQQVSGGTMTGNGFVTNRPISQNLSPSGTIQSYSNRSRSTDTLNIEGNYLEPTPIRPAPISRFHSGLRLGSVSSSGGGGTVGGPMSPDPHSPGSPNSITNILEVTTLNPLPINHPGISNLYQEFPLREHNNNISLSGTNIQHKKLSLDIPPQELAPSLNLSSLKTQSAVISNNNEFPVDDHRTGGGPQSPASTTNMMSSDSFDSAHMYMNITPGEMQPNTHKSFASAITSIGNSSCGGGSGCDTPQIAQTPTTTMTMFGMNRMNSSFSIDPNRLYENLDSGEIRPLLTRNTRFSKPDIFANNDKSEPCTPTIHYIVLDLDHSPASNGANNNQQQNVNHHVNLFTSGPSSSSSSGNAVSTNNSATATSTSLSSTTTTTTAYSTTISMSPISLLPPESPKKGVMDYATIDFNKTVALSNSTTPSSDLDSEGSRKTRHSSVAAPPSSSTKNSNGISD